MSQYIAQLAISVLIIAGSFTSLAEAAERKKTPLQAQPPMKRMTVAPPTTSAPSVTAIPLTAQECKGLGGTVFETRNDVCAGSGGKSCKTVDVHGVVRTACIDEVAK